MSKYEYRVNAPSGGYARGVKYRNPYYFDGHPEKDATSVAVIPGFDNIVSAYSSVGIQASIISQDAEADAAPNVIEDEQDANDSNDDHAQDEEIASPEGLPDDQLSALYESKFGRKPGNMKRDTILAALEDE